MPIAAKPLDFLNYGQLVLPEDRKAKGLILFYPPATGDKGHQTAEAHVFAGRGFASLLMIPPYRSKPVQGGIANPEAEAGLWLAARTQFQSLLKDIRGHGAFEKHSDLEQIKLAVIGKNLGGSVAAFATDDVIECLVVTGSVPILSSFWVRSEHPVAKEKRAGISVSQLEKFEAVMSEFDLSTTLRTKPSKVLLQFGQRDPWIEAEQFNTLSAALDGYKHHGGQAQIEWTDDDHLMSAPPSINRRMQFILESWG